MPPPQPALEALDDQTKHQIHADKKPLSDQPLLIGIDGNEANVTNRVGSNMVAYRLLAELHKMNTPYLWQIYLKNPPLSDLPPATKNWSYNVIPMTHFWTRIRLPWALYTQKPRPDIFFCPGHYAPSFCPCPLIVTILDTAYLDFSQYFKPRDLIQLKTWTKRAVNRADHIIAISQHTKNDLIKHYHKSEQQITVAHLGVDAQQFTFPQKDKDINRVKQKYHIPGDYILYVGTLQPRKNLPRLIEAFKLVLDQRQNHTPADPSLNFKNFTLVITGKKGWLYEDIFAKVKELKIENQVIFTDYVPDEDLPALMAGARCLALVALYEGFGIPVIEALKVGTPAVVSHTSSLPEILGHSGFTANPYQIEDIAHKLGQMLDLSSQDYYKLVDKGLRHAEIFTWDKTASQVLQVIEHLAGLPT